MFPEIPGAGKKKEKKIKTLDWRQENEIREWEVDSTLTEERKDAVRNLLSLVNHQERVIDAFKMILKELS